MGAQRWCEESFSQSWWPHETADSAGGGPALKPTKSDSCPQSHKKTTVRRQLASPRPSVMRDSNVEAADVARGVPLRPARVGDADSAHVWTCGSPNARARPADRLARRTLRRQGQGTRASASQQVCAAGWHEPQPAARLRRRLARSRSQATRSSAPRGALFLSRPVVVNNFLSHAPASLNVLRARRKRAVSGAGLEPAARTFRTTATQALAALGVAHPCIGAGGVLTLVPTRLAGSPTSRPFSSEPVDWRCAAGGRVGARQWGRRKRRAAGRDIGRTRLR